MTILCLEGGPHGAERPDDVDHEARVGARLRELWAGTRPAWTEEPWWDTALRDEVRRLLWLEAGPGLAAAVAQVPSGGSCPSPHEGFLGSLPTPGSAPGWPCACQVVLAAAWEACAGWVAARAAQALVDAAGPQPVELPVAGGRQLVRDPAREELAHALRWTIPSTSSRIAAARSLTAHPEVVDLVASATVSAWAGRLITDHLAGLTEAEAERVVADVASRARRRLASGRRPYHSAEINRLARAARLRICPESEQEARLRAVAGRRVLVQPQRDGMATLIADLPEVDAHRIHRRLTSIAQGLQADATPEEPETRTRDQLRADILTDLLVGVPRVGHAADVAPDSRLEDAARDSRPEDLAPAGRPAGTPPDSHPAGTAPNSRPEIHVIATLETLLGMSGDPAELPGLGPIPAETARALAADGRWTAWITDSAGTVTATGSRGYVPSAAVARLVRAREPHCRFPGCRHPATRCDLDHAIPWPRGATTAANLGPLCRRHHVLKTHAEWDLRPEVAAVPDEDPADQVGLAARGWGWRSPAGFTITDGSPSPTG